MREPRWLERLEAAVDGPGRVGLAGLYGGRRLRRAGRHARGPHVPAPEGPGTLRPPGTDGAAGDGGGIIPGMIPFAKGHGLGNDYIVINAADLPAALTAPQITRICDRNWGVGSDGILLLTPPWDGADFGLRILNPDGSEAEKSGNGLRIFAKYLHDHAHAKMPTLTAATNGMLSEST